MPTTEERLASLEAGMHRTQDILTGIAEIRTAITGLRTELRAEIKEVSDEVRELRTDTNRQFIDMRTEAHRDFKWVVGIQLTTMAGVIAALVGALYRQ